MKSAQIPSTEPVYFLPDVTETDARTTKEVADHVIVLPGNSADQIRIHFLNLGDHPRTRKIANESPLALAVNALKNELGQHDELLRVCLL